MLIQFSVENFLSFKEKTVFSLLATSDDSHPDHIVVSAKRVYFGLLLSMDQTLPANPISSRL